MLIYSTSAACILPIYQPYMCTPNLGMISPVLTNKWLTDSVGMCTHVRSHAQINYVPGYVKELCEGYVGIHIP